MTVSCGPRTFHLLDEVEGDAQPQHVAVHTRVVNRTVTVLVLRLIETQNSVSAHFEEQFFTSFCGGHFVRV